MNPKKELKSPAKSYVFVARDTGRLFLRVSTVLSLVTLCVGATLSITQRTFGAMLVTGVAAALLVIL